jgi:light-regulated signal transduction histidine kinase (bacteriophytochrome)
LINQVWEEICIINTGRRMELKIGYLPQAVGDRGLLKQAIENLISNAVKFTKLQEEAIIEVGAEKQGTEMVYYVKDNGVGFDMAHYHKLFGVFQRLHGDQDFEGTGIGLSIVQRIIHRHGGRTWAEGKPDAGAIFYFTLPGPPTFASDPR